MSSLVFCFDLNAHLTIPYAPLFVMGMTLTLPARLPLPSIMQQGSITTLDKSDMGLIFRGFNKTVDEVPTGTKMELIIQVGVDVAGEGECTEGLNACYGLSRPSSSQNL